MSSEPPIRPSRDDVDGRESLGHAKNLAKRFLKKVDLPGCITMNDFTTGHFGPTNVYVPTTEECWTWGEEHAFDGNGCYGKFWNPTTEKMEATHRFSYLFFRGRIPDGVFVLHTCDNKACVNPDHLYLGTGSDNNHDAYRRGRKATKLSKDDVIEIRRRSDAGDLGKDLAEEFGVSESMVSQVLSGDRYAWVEDSD